MKAEGLSPVTTETVDRWYAVHTLPQREGTAEAHLLRQGFHVYVPRISTVKRHARRIEKLKIPLFPRYGFVRLDLGRDRWRSINGTTGVTSLVMARDFPAPVPVGVVEALVLAQTNDGVVDFDWGFRPGDEVCVVSGPFSGALGVLKRLTPTGRVEMLLSLLNVTVRMSVARDVLEPAHR